MPQYCIWEHPNEPLFPPLLKVVSAFPYEMTTRLRAQILLIAPIIFFAHSLPNARAVGGHELRSTPAPTPKTSTMRLRRSVSIFYDLDQHFEDHPTSSTEYSPAHSSSKSSFYTSRTTSSALQTLKPQATDSESDVSPIVQGRVYTRLQTQLFPQMAF